MLWKRAGAFVKKLDQGADVVRFGATFFSYAFVDLFIQ